MKQMYISIYIYKLEFLYIDINMNNNNNNLRKQPELDSEPGWASSHLHADVSAQSSFNRI